MTQFVLSSCEKTEEGEKGLKQASGEQQITLSETQERRQDD